MNDTRVYRLSWASAESDGRVELIRIFVTFALAVIVLAPVPASTGFDSGKGSRPVDLMSRQAILETFQSAAGYFIENRGQVDETVRYYLTGDVSVAFRDDGVLFMVRDIDAGRGRESLTEPVDRVARVDATAAARSFAYLVQFEGANRVLPIGVHRLPFNSNFLVGGAPNGWRTDIPNYLEILYQDIYDGIDLAYRVESGRVKYEFVLRPGANPSRVIMRYEGIDDAALQGGNLVLQTAAGEIRDSAPIAFQGADEVRCAFTLREGRRVGFDCVSWDESRELVIDPLVYSTYLGGGDVDQGQSVATDMAGDAYITGYAASVDFPVTPGAFDVIYNGSRDAFVVKLDPSGSSLIYSTYVGGSGNDMGLSIAVDPGGNAYVTGTTSSADFPITPGAYDNTYNGSGDLFVAKLNPAGSSLIYSTYLGGSGVDQGSSIAIDTVGDACVTGYTYSADFPVTPGALDLIFNGSSDAFVARLNPAGSSLIYSTYLGGDGYDTGGSLAVDSAGDVYVTGTTSSVDFPVTPGAFAGTYNGSSDAFVAKLNPAGSSLIYSTYLGGSGVDQGSSIAIDTVGDACVTGYTYSADFPVTLGALDTTSDGSSDLFVAKLNPTGNALVYSTYLGGAGRDEGTSIAIDIAGASYVTGYTTSTDFPVTPDAVDKTFNGSFDSFVAKLESSGSSLVYSTYLGGSGEDEGWSISTDLAGDAYVTGGTHSTDFPVTPGAFREALDGPSDAFVVRLRIPDAPPAMAITLPAGGEVWIQQSSHTVAWTASDRENPPSALLVWINYTSGAGGGDICGPVAGNVGTCSWTLPAITATDVVVNGTVIDPYGLRGYDESGSFTIMAQQVVNTPPTVVIGSPTGGESWLGGSSHTITWTMHDGQDDNANLTIYINYTIGANAHQIASALKGAISVDWTLPNIEATDVVVNITVIDTGGLRNWSQSGPFTIKSASSTPPPEDFLRQYWWVLVIIVAVVIVLLLILAMKRRKPKEEEEMPKPSVVRQGEPPR